MLLKDLKKVAYDCCFNPNKPTKEEKIVMEVGNPRYWITKVIETLKKIEGISEDSSAFNISVNESIKLLILTRAYCNEKNKKPEKTRKRPSRPDSENVKAS